MLPPYAPYKQNSSFVLPKENIVNIERVVWLQKKNYSYAKSKRSPYKIFWRNTYEFYYKIRSVPCEHTEGKTT